jgi:hypothetical protein
MSFACVGRRARFSFARGGRKLPCCSPAPARRSLAVGCGITKPGPIRTRDVAHLCEMSLCPGVCEPVCTCGHLRLLRHRPGRGAADAAAMSFTAASCHRPRARRLTHGKRFPENVFRGAVTLLTRNPPDHETRPALSCGLTIPNPPLRQSRLPPLRQAWLRQPTARLRRAGAGEQQGSLRPPRANVKRARRDHARHFHKSSSS